MDSMCILRSLSPECSQPVHTNSSRMLWIAASLHTTSHRQLCWESEAGFQGLYQAKLHRIYLFYHFLHGHYKIHVKRTVLSGQLCFAKNSYLIAYWDIKETFNVRCQTRHGQPEGRTNEQTYGQCSILYTSLCETTIQVSTWQWPVWTQDSQRFSYIRTYKKGGIGMKERCVPDSKFNK